MQLRSEKRTKFVFGTVDQHTQIVASDAETTADVIFRLLFQKDGSENGSVSFGKSFEDFSHGNSSFLGYGLFFDADHLVRHFKMLGFQRNILVTSAIMLEKNMVADRIDIGAEPGGFADAAVGANRAKHAGKRLLAQIIDRIGSQKARAKF